MKIARKDNCFQDANNFGNSKFTSGILDTYPVKHSRKFTHSLGNIPS